VTNVCEAVVGKTRWVGLTQFLLVLLLFPFSPEARLRPKDWTLKRKPGKKPQQQEQQPGVLS